MRKVNSVFNSIINYFKKATIGMWVYNTSFLVGICFLILIILKNENVIFPVGFAIIYYSLNNVLIRNFASGNVKEMATDLLDCSLITFAILYVVKSWLRGNFDVSNNIFIFFFLYIGAIILITIFMLILVWIGKKRNNHWS
ncbi:hypothetical protein [Staphylococcus simulans]|uniref:hypothetical protein n=1 Tax=Staphylococcus simulans TaxID=1286 RepID=UPI0027EC0DBD|nr:hypothetical protein [Staphylococcus simulans]MDQ7113390.1 hypothetical protein [Staphylococcus simulans]MDQ7117326.1 hypothetical protein [Staphylococcus simulans]